MLREAGERTEIAFAEMLGIIKGLCLNPTANKLLYNKGNSSLSSFLQNIKYTIITIKPNNPAAGELCACGTVDITSPLSPWIHPFLLLENSKGPQTTAVNNDSKLELLNLLLQPSHTFAENHNCPFGKARGERSAVSMAPGRGEKKDACCLPFWHDK